MVKLTAQAAGTPWPVRLGERLTAFGNLSLALLLALLTGRLLELSGVLVTTGVPRDVGMVIVAALRSDLVLFLELLVRPGRRDDHHADIARTPGRHKDARQ